MSKLALDDLAFLVIALVHRALVDFLGGGSGPSGVRVGLESCIPNSG
jgi:hypothetical protein